MNGPTLSFRRWLNGSGWQQPTRSIATGAFWTTMILARPQDSFYQAWTARSDIFGTFLHLGIKLKLPERYIFFFLYISFLLVYFSFHIFTPSISEDVRYRETKIHMWIGNFNNKLLLFHTSLILSNLISEIGNFNRGQISINSLRSFF